jgi:CRISPR/Cas system CSM-associated protein Csm3 (group 7 of RAMP superfamily)
MSSYKKRYIANIVIEAISPLKVGSNSLDMLQDSPVQKDWNALPMILGTSITGVLRKEFDTTFANDIFGDEDSQNKDAKGSRVIISNALLCNYDMSIIETLGLSKDESFLLKYENLPLRDHVKINHQGVADIENKGKFDEEVVYAGSRFKFRLELMANDGVEFKKLLQQINSKTFRLGGGTTKGFGAIKVITEASTHGEFTLNSKEYREKSSSLNTTFEKDFPKEKAEITHTVYKLNIKPDDFFMFGSGFGEDDIKMIPVKEKIVIWTKEGKGSFSEEQILIPASSVKGALSHRTAFYYNKAIGATIESGEAKVDENNDAVKAIFGHKKELAENKETELGQKGKLLISDCFKEDKKETKVFDHVSIDRFTGGAIEGALFNEKTIAQRDNWEVEILLENDVNKAFVIAFEEALKDVCNGMLALGGAITKGHGVFCGTVEKDGTVIRDGRCSNEK